ncbi:MAG: translation initiation factor IF-3 [Spirochaetaceae bacterium]|nr:translation initiation factor IF-3 [Spirochaetaceae bacterium]
MAGNKDLRINERIRVREVRLITDSGEQLGILPTVEALAKARDAGLDLVEVSPLANPPVCKIIDYGKYKFQMGKKARDSKKLQKTFELKPVTMSPVIDTHDLEVKIKNIQRLLQAGNKVKVVVRFYGRLMAHTELGNTVLDKILARLSPEDYSIEKNVSMEGKLMSMVLAPKSKK